MNKFWFEVPTQVKFYDPYESEDENAAILTNFTGGIAFEDKIICGCCGGVISIDELYEGADEDKFTGEVIIPMEWIDISETIIGE